jgi:3-methyladenine DNA glycosylase AlkD
MTYLEFLDLLKAHKEEAFAVFQRKLIPTSQEIIGVRTPTLRQIAKEYREYLKDIFNFPNVVYEVTFIKHTIVSLLPYEEFLMYVEPGVSLIDNWATCDSFKTKCIVKNKENFLSVIEKLFKVGKEFYQRYALTVLLANYVEEKYISLLKEYLYTANTDFYYVHMASAWLLAEILIKHFDFGVAILNERKLPVKTHNKAIQKAIESYRLTKEQKEYLRSLKIK